MRTRDRPASGPRSPAAVGMGGVAFAGECSCLSDRGELLGRWPRLMRSPPLRTCACRLVARSLVRPQVGITSRPTHPQPSRRLPGMKTRRGSVVVIGAGVAGLSACSVAGATGRPRCRPRSHSQSRGVLRDDRRGRLPLQRWGAVSDASPGDGRDLRTSEHRFLRPGAPARALTAADRTRGRHIGAGRIRPEGQLPARPAGHTPSGGRATALAPALAPRTSGSDQRRVAVGLRHAARPTSVGWSSPAEVCSEPRSRAELRVWRACLPLA